jgi:hypothetical protein
MDRKQQLEKHRENWEMRKQHALGALQAAILDLERAVTTIDRIKKALALLEPPEKPLAVPEQKEPTTALVKRSPVLRTSKGYGTLKNGINTKIKKEGN